MCCTCCPLRMVKVSAVLCAYPTKRVTAATSSSPARRRYLPHQWQIPVAQPSAVERLLRSRTLPRCVSVIPSWNPQIIGTKKRPLKSGNAYCKHVMMDRVAIAGTRACAHSNVQLLKCAKESALLRSHSMRHFAHLFSLHRNVSPPM